MAIARRHGIKVVEDCAQALDCRIDGQHVGTFGDFGCFSFHAAKTMTTLGEGGMFVCSDARWLTTCRASVTTACAVPGGT